MSFKEAPFSGTATVLLAGRPAEPMRLVTITLRIMSRTSLFPRRDRLVKGGRFSLLITDAGKKVMPTIYSDRTSAQTGHTATY